MRGIDLVLIGIFSVSYVAVMLQVVEHTKQKYIASY